MSKHRNIFSLCWTALARQALRLGADRRGNVAIIMGLSMVPIVGALGLGFEVSNWYLRKHAMQNTADAAAIAAGINASSNYDVEAKAVAAQDGFVDGSNNVTVTASNTATCPAGGNNCYSVTISSYVPLFLSEVLGYSGNSTLNGKPQQSLSATAVATQGIAPTQFCLLALASSGAQGIRSNGAPNANMAACAVMSDTTSTCNGGNLNANIGAAHGRNNGCGNNQYSNVAAVSDPYSGLASNIPANPCGSSYPQEPTKKGRPGAPFHQSMVRRPKPERQCHGLRGSPAHRKRHDQRAIERCSRHRERATRHERLFDNDLERQRVDRGLFRHELRLLHPCTHGRRNARHLVTDHGPLERCCALSGPEPDLWRRYLGGRQCPTWDISGLVYLPHSSVTFSGAVNKASNGQSCFAMVVDNVLVNGTGSILETGGCAAQGLSMPTGNLPSRAQLVL